MDFWQDFMATMMTTRVGLVAGEEDLVGTVVEEPKEVAEEEVVVATVATVTATEVGVEVGRVLHPMHANTMQEQPVSLISPTVTTKAETQAEPRLPNAQIHD